MASLISQYTHGSVNGYTFAMKKLSLPFISYYVKNNIGQVKVVTIPIASIKKFIKDPSKF